jgi:protein associated with RNAse G/E
MASIIVYPMVLLQETIVFDDIKLSLCKYDSKVFCQDFDVWSFNRKLRTEHVDKIYIDLCSQKIPYLMGSIKVIKDKNNQVRIIDGQHRLQALKMLIDNNINKTVSILVEIYHVPSLDSDIVFELFKIANNNLNVTVEDEIDMFIVNLVNRLVVDKELSKGIIDKNDGKVYRPRISKKMMYEELKKNLKAEHMKLSVQVVVDRIKMINKHLSKMDCQQLFGRKETSQTNVNIRCNAAKYGFFLNMTGRYPPEKWIDLISNIDKI